MIGKLVRDGIPRIIRSDGKEPKTSQLDDQGYRIELNNKLFEEAREMVIAITSGTRNDQREELADILEVLKAIADHQGIPWKNVEEERVRKFKERGGFEGRIWLEDYR